MPATDLLPARPRRSSAGTVRRHRKYLAYRIRQVAPGAVRVRATAVETDGGVAYVVLALDTHGQSIKLPPGGMGVLAELLRGAWPRADWLATQTWHADGNRLVATHPHMPRWLKAVA